MAPSGEPRPAWSGATRYGGSVILAVVRSWSRRRWGAAGAVAIVTVVAVAVPTAMIDTPIFGRPIGVTWWSWPVLAVTAVLTGVLAATYVRNEPGPAAGPVGGGGRADLDPAGKRGIAGGFLAFFAVGCPVCNKLVLLALGYTGALRWFAPFQPVLAVAAVVLLGWALRARLAGEVSCPVSNGGPVAAGDTEAGSERTPVS